MNLNKMNILFVSILAKCKRILKLLKISDCFATRINYSFIFYITAVFLF